MCIFNLYFRCVLYQFLVAFLSYVESARILAHIPTPTFSHQIVNHRILKELSKRGHDIVCITSMPFNDPESAIREIDVSEVSLNFWKNSFDGAAALSDQESLKRFHTVMRGLSDRQLSVPEVRQLINNGTEHFDLIYVEWVFYYATYGWMHRFHAPMIGLLTLDTYYDGHDFVGNPTHPYLFQATFMDFLVGNTMTLAQRIKSTWMATWLRYKSYSYLQSSEAILKKHFGENCPSIQELAERVSVVFLAGNNIWTPRIHVPNVVIFDSIHVESAKPLPKNLQAYLDSCTKGVVYFSLGSNFKSNNLPPEKLKIFLRAFASLPHCVLWKWENDKMAGRPENVKIAKWLPQQDVLAHTNVKLFVTQGGIQSMEEAIDRCVPILGIPLMTDQMVNVNIAVRKGMGKMLNFERLTSDTIVDAVREIMTNDSYQINAERIAALMKDQMVPPLERVVWHIEFILRHNGLPDDMRHHRLPTWKHLMLDMVGISLMALIALGYIFWSMSKNIYKIFFSTCIVRPKKKTN